MMIQYRDLDRHHHLGRRRWRRRRRRRRSCRHGSSRHSHLGSSIDDNNHFDSLASTARAPNDVVVVVVCVKVSRTFRRLINLCPYSSLVIEIETF